MSQLVVGRVGKDCAQISSKDSSGGVLRTKLSSVLNS